ncbi:MULTISPECIES: vWA domain-containing protein [Methylococcus]|jgi:mxaC protein|uniref:MxaC protein n=1 Tax=Methylococcus capsulatus TaxID=414 RepID=A0AA35V6R3_METCP|nr:vWA domain-containing protein [Methylococcus capsulatus]QXP90863.1 VWA domain-containing protein [Methylococcus capsulatus]QXP92478.1 VWA domain-containing protein [Methylococcus capsulatus]CAI8881936.1 mxaC protein [Methylococcus capsulatus]
MSFGFVSPWWLLLGAGALLPWLRPGQPAVDYSSLAMMPEDRLSVAIDRGLRALTSLALAALAAGIAGPYALEQWEERLGTGAHIVLLMDRSSSMNENFSGRYLGGTAGESKNAVARRLLADFVRRRGDDLFAMVAFSAAPRYVMPLTQDREAVLAAIDSVGDRGHGITNIAPGLAMALDFFNGRPATGARIILLVSDGATRIEEESQDMIRQWFQDSQSRLYWIYLRSTNSAPLDRPPTGASDDASPEYLLHRYFQSLGVPYTAYEATNPRAVEEAIADIGRLANQPLRYLEKVPRKDLSGWCYGCALILLLPLLAAKSLEVHAW